MSIKFYNNERVDSLFELTWFGRNLTAKSGVNLWGTDEVTMLNQPAYSMKLPLNWLDDPFNHRSWRWMLNSFHWMDSLLGNFKIHKDQQSIQKCVNYFFDWADFYIIKEQKGEFLWKDDAVSFRTYRLLIISQYILKEYIYSDEEKQLTKFILEKHIKELLEPKKFKRNNHGIFQMRALMGFCVFYPELVALKEVKEYIVDNLNWLWIAQYGTQNLHLENSTGYHQYAIEEFYQILKSPEFSSIKFEFDEDNIQTARDNIKFLFHPNGIGTLFGDSNLATKELDIPTGDHFFNEAGYAVLAGSDSSKYNSYLAIRTGFPSHIHRHSDDFSFEWSEKGQIILQDSGRYSYDYEDPYRVFISSSKGHNTVTINNLNFPWWGSFDKSDFYSGAICEYHGDQKRAKLTLQKTFDSLEVDFKRSFDIKRGESLSITDCLVSGKCNTYEQWFHLAEDFEYLGVDTNGRFLFESDILRIAIVGPKDTDFLLAKGQKEPFIQGWVSYKEKKVVPRWAFGFRAEANNFRFETKIIII